MCLTEINFHLRSSKVGYIGVVWWQSNLQSLQLKVIEVHYSIFFWNCLLLDSSVFCSCLTGFYKHPKMGIYNANTDRTIALLGPTIHSSNRISYFSLSLSYTFWHCNLQKLSCLLLLDLEILFYTGTPFSKSKARPLSLPSLQMCTSLEQGPCSSKHWQLGHLYSWCFCPDLVALGLIVVDIIGLWPLLSKYIILLSCFKTRELCEIQKVSDNSYSMQNSYLVCSLFILCK